MGSLVLSPYSRIKASRRRRTNGHEDERVAEKQVAEKQVEEKQVAEKQVAEKQVAEKQVAEKQVAEKQVSFRADRRENQGARRLARQDAQPVAYLGQASRSRSRRGVEVERRSGMVTRRIDLHGRDLQERGEDDLRQRGGSEGPFGPLQL